jgi:hypothetical protein
VAAAVIWRGGGGALAWLASSREMTPSLFESKKVNASTTVVTAFSRA